MSGEMQQSVDDDAMQFVGEGSVHLLGIAGYGIEGDIDVAVHTRTRGIIKSNDVGVVVVLEELAIDRKDLLVVAEDIMEFAHGKTILRSHGTNPTLDLRNVERREFYIFG